MKLLIDENVDVRVVRALRETEHEVEWIAETRASDQDEAILGRPDIADCVLITFDRDFGELIFRKDHPRPAALIYSRLPRLNPEAVAARILAVLHDDDYLQNLIVLSPSGDRRKPFEDTHNA